MNEPISNPTVTVVGVAKKPSYLKLGGSLIFPIIMAIVGLSTVNSCPAEKNIPIFLIVGGLMLIAALIMRAILTHAYDEAEKPAILKYMVYTVDVFNLIWFFVGSIWTYSAYQPNYDDEKSLHYCNQFMYIFTFCWFTIVYVLTGVFIVAIVYKMIFPDN